MARILNAIARLQRDCCIDLPIDQKVRQLAAAQGSKLRQRLLPAAVAVRLFLLQILHGNVAIAALRQLSGIDFAPSSYCEARAKLAPTMLQSLMQWIASAASAMTQHRVITPRCGRVLIVDGSSHSMSDTQELREHFDLPPGQKPGVGYPAGKLMGLLDAATGMFVQLLSLPLFQHDMRSAIQLHPMLKSGDILLGDRAFCSFAHVALLNAQGVFACFRLHQRRKSQGRRGSDRWSKPQQKSSWMSDDQFALLPPFVDVRLVSYTLPQRGYRTTKVTLATTLMDPLQWPDDRIMELYGQRWDIETCFDHLKTTMGMAVLHCKTMAGVEREMAMVLIAYNLVRLAMLRAAARQGVSVSRISFIDAMRFLCTQMLSLPGVQRLIINPKRTGRQQLRVRRRRPKEYDLLQRSRREEEAIRAGKQG